MKTSMSFISKLNELENIFEQVEKYKNSEKTKKDEEKLEEFLKTQGKHVMISSVKSLKNV